jgi:hypothetical protein
MTAAAQPRRVGASRPEERRERVGREVPDGADVVQREGREKVEGRLRREDQLEECEAGRPGGEDAEPAPLAPSDPPQSDEYGEELEVRGERDRPRGADRGEQRQRDLRLANRDAPPDRDPKDADRQPRLPAPGADPPDRHCEARDHHGFPDRGRSRVWQQGERTEEDREQRRVEVSRGAIDVLVGRIERLPGVQARGGIVISVNVGQRVGRHVEPEHVDAGEGTDDRQRAQAAPNWTHSCRRGRHASSL